MKYFQKTVDKRLSAGLLPSCKPSATPDDAAGRSVPRWITGRVAAPSDFFRIR